jgi:citrate synthase
MTDFKNDDARGSPYVSGPEAAKLLGIKAKTLYAYVSRGFIRSVPAGTQRGHLYRRADIERLRLRSDARSGREAAAAGAMSFGDPIIFSSITELTAAGPSYRGRAAIELGSSGLTYEQVAAFLWTGTPPERNARAWESIRLPRSIDAIVGELAAADGTLAVHDIFALAAVARGISRETGAYDATLEPRAVVQTLFASLGLLSHPRALSIAPGQTTLATAVLRTCRVAETESNVRAIDELLILYADHELAPATFVARVAASFGAELSACAVSAIESSGGSESEFADISRLVSDVQSREELHARIRVYRDNERLPPGLTSPALYPDGDPRARRMLELARTCAPDDPVIAIVSAVVAELREALNVHPKAPLGLKLLAIALGLTDAQAFGLYLAARSAGWVAHCLEQYASPAALRPRAKYRQSSGPATAEDG